MSATLVAAGVDRQLELLAVSDLIRRSSDQRAHRSGPVALCT